MRGIKGKWTRICKLLICGLEVEGFLSWVVIQSRFRVWGLGGLRV